MPPKPPKPRKAPGPTKVQLKVYVTPHSKQVLADYSKQFNVTQSRAVEDCVVDVLAPELVAAKEENEE